MQIEPFSWQGGWDSDAALKEAELLLYFASPDLIRTRDVASLLSARYPAARQIGCSTGGEIYCAEFIEGSLSGVALRLDRSEFTIAQSCIAANKTAQDIGAELAGELLREHLRLVFVLSDGLGVNGSELIRGFKSVLPDSVLLTGGLAGDGAAFESTYVGVDAAPVQGCVAALGFYGRDFHCRSGCKGGWQVFGPQRIITRSEGNILYELDDKPALDLYKQYLGEEADTLPGSAMLYPLAIRPPGQAEQDVVRTIVGIDESQRSLTFAGDVPIGYSAQLMTSNYTHLADGAQESARQALAADGNERTNPTELAILISCIGRKLLMGQMVADEVDAVREMMPGTVLTGFYSYGEIAPHGFTGSCELHNQTMTITTMWEG